MSGNYRAVLDAVLGEIEKAKTLDDKKKVAMASYSKEYIQAGALDFSTLTKTAPKDIYDKTVALAIAISLVDVSACEKLLPYYDANSINDPNSFVWGYRELYTFMHLALDPNGHFHKGPYQINVFELSDAEKEALQNNLIKIINLLAAKGADANLIPGQTAYHNPAMAGGSGRGHGLLYELLTPLRGELVLAGANPDVRGSYFTLEIKDRTPIMDYAQERFNQANDAEKLAIVRKMHPEMKQAIATPFINELLGRAAALAQLAGVKMELPATYSNAGPSFF